MNKYITFVWLLMCNDFTGLTTVQMEKYLYMFILFNNTRYLGGIGEERGVQMEGIYACIRRYKMYNVFLVALMTVLKILPSRS